jgi:tetratricopeptide (TPR) repeat protein
MRLAARTLTCFALMGAFVIQHPHCGRSYDHHQLSLVYLEKDQYRRSLVETERDLRLNGPQASTHMVSALAHLGLDEIDQAVVQMRLALGLDPANAEFYKALRGICAQKERFDLARSTFADLLQKDPENDLARASLGWAYMQMGDDDRALDLLQRAVSGTAGLFARVQLARLYLKKERVDEAIHTLETALEIEPDNADLLLTLGEFHLLRGQVQQAEPRFAAAVAASQDPRQMANAVARIYYDKGMRRRAIDYYELALGSGPPPADLLNNLAWAYAEESIKLERGLHLSMLSLKVAPDSPVYLDTYAELYFRKGEADRASAIIRRALELEPKDGQHYEYLQQQQAKFDSAIAAAANL